MKGEPIASQAGSLGGYPLESIRPLGRVRTLFLAGKTCVVLCLSSEPSHPPAIGTYSRRHHPWPFLAQGFSLWWGNAPRAKARTGLQLLFARQQKTTPSFH
jgi:hypothetical protein